MRPYSAVSRAGIAGALILAVAGPAATAAPAQRAAPRPPSTPAVPKTRPQSLPEQIITMARADARRIAADRFADPTPLPNGAVGQPFRLEYTFANGEVAKSFYNDGRLRLSLDLKVGEFGDFGAKGARGLVIARRHKVRGSYQASNAFGATMEVSRSESRTDVLAMFRHPRFDAAPFDDPYFTEIATTGADAKALIASSAAIVEGRVDKPPKGGFSGCHIEYTTPTHTLPIDNNDEICWVAVNIERIAFVNASSGEVIHEWRKPPDRPASIEPIPPASLQGFYPLDLMIKRKQVTGTVKLSCKVTFEGWVRECAVVTEDPPGLGFGKKALSAMGLRQGAPAVIDGVAVEGTAETTLIISPPERR